MQKSKNAAIYARYSSSNQREESIDAQLRICRKYAEENGYSIVKEYTDSAISGRTDQRPAFQQMIQDSAKGSFDTLLIYSHDRFSRNKYETSTTQPLTRPGSKGTACGSWRSPCLWMTLPNPD